MANLIFISAETKEGAKYIIAGDNIYVGNTILGQKVSNGLYECLFVIGSVALVSFNIYDRLGHPGAPVEAIAATHYGVSNETHSNRVSCYRSKHTKLINKVLTRTSSDVLGLIHVDIVGPFQDIAADGSRYYLTLVDDLFRFLLLTAIASRSLAVKPLIFHL